MDVLNTGVKGLILIGVITAAFLPGRQTVQFTKTAFAGFTNAEKGAIRG
jgi:hypothetical protein